MSLQNLKKIRKTKQNYISLALCFIMVLSLTGCGKDDKESYRIIKLVEMTGTVTYSRDSETNDAYQNMNFQNGDKIDTSAESSAKLSLDSDKYLHMAANTSIELEAKGDEKDSKTRIKLNSGEITNEIQNKLSENSMYEVETSNATMAVQGTIFYVKVKDGKTIVYCEDGQVKVSAAGGSSTSLLEPQQAVIIEGATITSVPIGDILEEISGGASDALKSIREYLANVPGEPSGNGYEIYCACGAKSVCTVYTPTGFTIMGTGDIETDYGYRKMAVVFNPIEGIKNATVTTDDTVTATTAFTGSYSGSSQDFEFTVYDLAPVNNGSECKLIKYSYFHAEGWQKTFHFATIVVKYDSCDGETRGTTLKFQLDGDSIDWTLEDYQRIAYETFGR